MWYLCGVQKVFGTRANWEYYCLEKRTQHSPKIDTVMNYPTLEEMLRDIQYRIRYLLDPGWGDLFEFTRGMMRTLKVRLPQWMSDSDDRLD